MNKLLQEVEDLKSTEKTLKDFWNYKKNTSDSTKLIYKYTIQDLDDFCRHRWKSDGYSVIMDLKKIKDSKSEDIMKIKLWEVIEGWFDWCLNSKPETEFRKHQHINTVSKRFSKLKSFMMYFGLNFSQKEMYENCSIPRSKNNQPPALELKDIQKILQVCGVEWYPLLLTLISTGCRIDEVLRLQAGDFDITKERTVVHIRPENKTDTEHYVYLTEECEEWMIPIVKEKNPDEFVFVKSYHARSYDKFANRFRQILKDNGMYKKFGDNNRGGITLHRFRDFFIGQVEDAKSREYALKMTNHSAAFPNYGIKSAKKKMEYFKSVEHSITVLPENILKVRNQELKELQEEKGTKIKELVLEAIRNERRIIQGNPEAITN